MNRAGLLEGTQYGSVGSGAPHVPPRPDLDVLRPEDRDAAQRIAVRSAVLLKNDGGLLPLEKRPAGRRGR